ncbi:hypothetical protein C1Y40_03857 [Mycobacterium talmoniae]|uniref:Uncharacterized protein n=1 Tax=Mycobacterium talmoniae TaxID=1858794 RepID=A0A2S8BH77_9MYCO|nr:hypothetical protein C1Y40_03857 [Mycobacterium talmoniae]
MAPTNMHVQFLRGGDAGDAVEYAVERVFDGRTSRAGGWSRGSPDGC